MEEEVTAIVIDNGSATCKSGFAGDEQPKRNDPMLVGRYRNSGIMIGLDQKDTLFGEDVQSKRSILKVESPIENGIIRNWDDMEKYWQHIFLNLRVSPEEHPVFMTEAPLNPKQNRERMTQIMFESFNVPCLYVSVQGVLALYSSGRTSGLVLDSGEGVSHTIPIYEGYAVPHAIQRVSLAGKHVTEYLRNQLSRKGINVDFDVAREMKERLCYAVTNFDEASKESEASHTNEKGYDLPDGKKVVLSTERFRATEVLFNPTLAGLDLEGLPKYCFDSTMKCDVDVRKELLQNVILAGGNTLFEGMGEKMWQELHQLAPSTTKIKMLAPPERRFSAWLGGSILASLSTFQTMWINKQEYDDSGPSIIHRKCF